MGPEQQKAFEEIKTYLDNPPVLIPPTSGKPLKLNISINHDSIGSLLAQDSNVGFEQVMFYFSRTLTDIKNDIHQWRNGV